MPLVLDNLLQKKKQKNASTLRRKEKVAICAVLTFIVLISINCNLLVKVMNQYPDQPTVVKREAGKPTIWLLHFHKAGGSSFTTLAMHNNEKTRNEGGDHSHFELTNEKFRWELVDPSRLPSMSIMPMSCLMEKERSSIGKTLSFQQELKNGIIDEKITFISSEHWFPALHNDTWYPPLSNVKTVAVFREPMNRLLSSFYFHDCAANRCPKNFRKRYCSFKDWIGTESNMYTCMLNGQPFGPMKIGRQCSLDLSNVAVTQSHLENAKDALMKFDLILTLDTISNRKEVAECALRKLLGWDHTKFPQKNKGRKHVSRQCKEPEEWELQYAKKSNALDIQLYKHSVLMESKLLQSIGCN